MAARQASQVPLTIQAKSRMTRFTTEATPGSDRRLVRIRCSLQVSFVSRIIGRTSNTMVECGEQVGTQGFLFDIDDQAMDLRSNDACRGAVRQMLMKLPLLMKYYLILTDEREWDVLVPPGLVESLAAVEAHHQRSYTCDVTMHVHERIVYSEAKSVLLWCQRAAAREVAAAGARRCNVGGAAECSICMDDLTAASDSSVDVTELPGCRHAFHSACILTWFDTASTCPNCRRDMKPYLYSTT